MQPDRSARVRQLAVGGTKGMTELMKAAYFNDIEKVKLLLKKGADVNEKDEFAGTALIYAARKGNYEVVDLLLKHGADINYIPKTDTAMGGAPLTALMSAAYHGHEDVAKLLIEHGADVNMAIIVPGSRGGRVTALSLASLAGHDEMVRLLTEHGADMRGAYRGRIKAVEGIEELLLASETGDVSMVRRLLNGGIDVNKRGQGGSTALMCAVEGRNRDVVSLLLEHGAETNPALWFNISKARSAMTPLMRAAYNGDLEIVKLLVEHGADVSAQWGDIALYNEGATALLLARARGNDVVADYLKSIGTGGTRLWICLVVLTWGVSLSLIMLFSGRSIKPR